MLISQVCKQEHFEQPWFSNACDKLREPWQYHRKLWEWCFIYQALLEREMLFQGKTGLGFGVGTEPLVSLFASHGCRIVATDLDTTNPNAAAWIETNQHASNLSHLNNRGLCTSSEFGKLVTFEFADMNKISRKYDNCFDFTWSSCAFEHLGSIALGEWFIMEQMRCLKPGGIAVHTTEFNLSSNDNTIDKNKNLVIFRQKDIERIVTRLRSKRNLIEIDYSVGTGEIESQVDRPPYSHNPHLRLLLGGYVATSIALIVQKNKNKWWKLS